MKNRSITIPNAQGAARDAGAIRVTTHVPNASATVLSASLGGPVRRPEGRNREIRRDDEGDPRRDPRRCA
jgi:hypothetical protein